MRPPVAEKRPHTMQFHDDIREDEYFWLRNKEDAAVTSYLEAENEYFQAYMEPLRPLQEKIFAEIKGRIKEHDESVPARHGDYWYGARFEEGKEYEVHFRRYLGPGGKEDIILDENERADGLEYYSLGAFNWSHDHRYLAFSEDTDGSERYTLRFRDLQTGSILREEIPATYHGVAWCRDNRTVFYVKLDDLLRPNKVFRHYLGNDPAFDEMVYEEKDPRFFVGLGESHSGDYVIISSDGNNTSEAWYLATDDPQGEFKCLAPRRMGIEYGIDQRGDHFFIMTNEDALDFRIVKAPISDPSHDNWVDVVPHRYGRLLTDFICFRDYLIVFEKQDAIPGVRVMRTDGHEHVIHFPEVGRIRAGRNFEHDSHVLRVSFSSPITPDTIYDYDLELEQFQTLKVRTVPSGYDKSKYAMGRVIAEAKDGVSVPITIVYPTGLKKDGKAPVYLYAYGSYGSGMTAGFSVSYLSLIDRGFIVAIAHIRGGDDLGREWYEQGKMLHKMNTFNDYIACAQALITKGYTSQGKIVGVGGSAGGMLMGVAANLSPRLFAGLIAQVPFVDCLNTMLDNSLPLTQLEYNEWGNPHIKQYYDYIKSYSPYDNVTAQHYPHMFVSSGLNDPRVTYWEPTKWVARLRAKKTDKNILVLKTNMGAGHGGNTGRFEAIKETAEEFAFACQIVGITE